MLYVYFQSALIVFQVVRIVVFLGMTRFAFVSLAVAAVADSDIRKTFDLWKEEHGETFNGVEEEKHRFQVFKGTHLKIEEKNGKSLSYVLGHNFMSQSNESRVGEQASVPAFLICSGFD